MRRLRALILALLVIVVVGVAQLAVATADSGAVQVTVYEPKPDKTKEPVIGATVVITDTSKQYPEQALITNENGLVIFPLVQPGSNYVVTVSMVGYMKVTKKEVRVVSGVTSQVVVGLLPDIQEEVIVKGREKMIELDTEAQGSTSISGEEFQDLPVFGRDYQAVLTLAPGVQDSNNDGNPNVHGSRETDFRMSVDGVSNVDPLTGTRMSDINPDSIEEIEIIDSGADASFGGAVGGYGKIVTKSGSNKFEGSFNMFLQDSTFDGRGAGANDPVSFRRRQPSIYFSGPIFRDKLWFSLNHELIKISNPISLVNGPSYVQTIDAKRNSDKLTWQVTPKNKLQFEWRSDPYKIEPGGVDRFTREESGYTLKSGGPATTLKWTAPFSPTFFWEATVAYSNTGFDAVPYRPDAQNACVGAAADARNNFPFFSGFYCQDLTISGAGVASGAFSEIYHDKRRRWTYNVDGEQFIDRFLGGQHRIKGGFSVERVGFERDDTIAPFMTLRQNVNQDTIALGPRSQPPDAYLLEVDTYYYPGQGPPLDPLDKFKPQRGVDTATGNYYGFYLTDTFEPRTNLSITAGLRFSREELTADGYTPFDPRTQAVAYNPVQVGLDEWPCLVTAGSANQRQACIEKFERIHGFGVFSIHPLDVKTDYPQGCDVAINPALCAQLKQYLTETQGTAQPIVRSLDTISIASNGVAPRVNFSWDPAADAKTKISASWGRYFGDTFLAPLVAENGPDHIVGTYTMDGYRMVNKNPNTDLPDSPQAIDTGLSINMVDRNLKQQHSDEWTIGVEREIASETAIKVRYVNRHYENQLQDTDINHAPLTSTDVENRPTGGRKAIPTCVTVNGYYDCTGYYGRDFGSNGSGANGFHPDGVPDLKVVNPFLNNVYLVGNFNRSTYYAYIVELTRRYFQNWEMNASYTFSRTWGRAEDYNSSLGNDPTNFDKISGPLSIDQPHVFKLNGRVFVPRFGGFRVGGAVSWESGLPYSIVMPRNVTDFPADMSGCVPDQYITDPAQKGQCVSVEKFENVSTPRYTYETARTVFPTGHRNDQRNRAFWTVNVNFQKEFQVKDVKTSVQVEVFNLLNDNTEQIAELRQDFIGARLDTVTGQVTPVTIDRKIATQRFGRRFQLAVRLNF